MGWEWSNALVCPICGGEIAEKAKIYGKSFYICLTKKCKWRGTEPGEVHGRVLT